MLAPITCAFVVFLAAAVGAATVSAQSATAAERAAKGVAALEAGQFAAAAAIYAELVAAQPEDAGLLLNLGMARYMAGQPRAALDPLRRAVARQPSLVPASLFLGAALLDLGDIDAAIPPLRRAVTAMPEHADAREMLARAYLTTNHYAEAAAQYRRLTELRPADARAWYGLGRSYEGIAEQAFEALQRDTPESPVLALLVADLAVVQGKYEAALRIYRRALEDASPVGGLHEAVAELYDRAGKPEWAAIERRKAAVRAPAACDGRTPECEFLAGRLQASLRAAAAAPTDVNRYWAIRAANRLATEAVARLETLPTSVELHLIRAELAQARSQHADAVAEIRKALALAPRDATIELALAEALLHARNLDEALPLLERLHREHPDEGVVLAGFGEALLQNQDLERAVPVLEAAASRPGAPLAVRASLGRAYVQTGQHARALPHLEAAVVEDELGDVHYQLARAYQALNRPAEAEAALVEYRRRQTALQHGESSAEPGPLTPPE